MDYSIDTRKHQSHKHYTSDSKDLAYLFAKECHKECKDLIKAIILFGGAARQKEGTHDIDVLVIIDDVSIVLNKELTHTYRLIIGRIIANVSRRLHVTTMKFSSFWEYVRAGDPVAVNILRDGLPLLDTGIFDPLQLLLHQGRIRPSAEGVYAYLSRAQTTLDNSAWHFTQAAVDLYWAVIDSAHAALMSIGEVPVSPEHVAEMLEDKFVKTKQCPPWVASRMRLFYTLSKEIGHGTRKEMKATEYEKLQAQAQEFVAAMKKIVEKN